MQIGSLVQLYVANNQKTKGTRTNKSKDRYDFRDKWPAYQINIKQHMDTVK